MTKQLESFDASHNTTDLQPCSASHYAVLQPDLQPFSASHYAALQPDLQPCSARHYDALRSAPSNLYTHSLYQHTFIQEYID